jgi:ribonuclease HII
MRRDGFRWIAGTDEVGRGCLAGPVVAAAVVLDPDRHIPGLADSKLLTAAARERLFVVIAERAAAWAVGSASPAEIDQLNIHKASLEAMRRAVLALEPLPDCVLVDAFTIPGIEMAQRAVAHGDRCCAAIAAASIMAKVTRDREMCTHHGRDPRYGFDRHKGYATEVHLVAVGRYGYSTLHRQSFRARALFDRIET